MKKVLNLMALAMKNLKFAGNNKKYVKNEDESDNQSNNDTNNSTISAVLFNTVNPPKSPPN